jgi:DNA polymerase-3 subunit delta'
MKIIGQNLALKYLTEGLRTDRLSPSLLFVGPSGVGKRSCAIQLAKCFVCQSPSFESVGTDLPFCNDCQACERIQNNNHSDLFVLDRSSQAVILGEKTESQSSIKIEAIRYVEKFLQLKPTESKKTSGCC